MIVAAIIGTLFWLAAGMSAAGKELDNHHRFGTSQFNPEGQAAQRSTSTKYIVYGLMTMLGLLSWLVISASDGAPQANLKWRWVT